MAPPDRQTQSPVYIDPDVGDLDGSDDVLGSNEVGPRQVSHFNQPVTRPRRSYERQPRAVVADIPPRSMSFEKRRSIGYRPSVDVQPTRTSLASAVYGEMIAQDIELARDRLRRSVDIRHSTEMPSPHELALGPAVEEAQHKVPIEMLLRQLDTDGEKGLTNDERLKRLDKYGRNELTPPKQTPWYVRLLKAMFSAFSDLLWVAAIASFISYAVPKYTSPGTEDSGYLWLGIVLIAVNIISGTFTFVLEYKANAIMASFSQFTPSMANVIVDGHVREVPSTDIVPGDIVVVNGGEKVPADMRMLSVHGLKVDMCSFTGETEAILRTTEATDDIQLHSRNISFFGSSATEGTGTGVVIRTGDSTELGQIAKLAAAKSTSKKSKREAQMQGMSEEERKAFRKKERKEAFSRAIHFWRKPPIDHDSGETPMRVEINYFVKMVAIIAVIVALICLIISFIYKPKKWLDNILFGIGICVALVPEGLLITVTLSLAITARRMASRRVLVKNTESIETLGSCSVIVSDKTGTLTQNRMTVGGLFYDLHSAGVRASYNKQEFTGDFDLRAPTMASLTRCMHLCSRAEFDPDDTENPGNVFLQRVRGDASETALLRFAASLTDYAGERDAWPKLAELPFNSRNKFSATVHQRPLPSVGEPDARPILYFKGAPERVLARCTHYLHDGEIVPIDDEFRKAYDKAYNDFGGQGMRVLAFAQNDLAADPYGRPDYEFVFEDDSSGRSDDALLTGLTFVGLAALLDPPRDEVPAAVAECRSAYIKVVMATGDHPTTAQAIARQIGLVRGKSDVDYAKEHNMSVEAVRKDLKGYGCTASIVAGPELVEMDEDELTTLLSTADEIVLARMSPADKLRVVRAFQSMGNIVASLGDGVNDSPHISQADIGVSMMDGSQVTKDVADLILLDNSFASIVAGVYEGRLMFTNVRKSIAYTLTSNIPELLPFVLQLILQMPLALTTIQILAIDLGTDLAPAISFTYEPAESGIMNTPPRDPFKDSLISGRMLGYVYGQIGPMQAGALFTSFLLTLCMLGHRDRIIGNIDANGIPLNDLRMAQSAGFFTVIVVQIADALISKTRKASLFSHPIYKNTRMLAAFLFEVVLGLALVFIPGVNGALGMAAWDSALYALPSLCWFVVLIIYDELRKLAIRKKPNGLIERLTYY